MPLELTYQPVGPVTVTLNNVVITETDYFIDRNRGLVYLKNAGTAGDTLCCEYEHSGVLAVPTIIAGA